MCDLTRNRPRGTGYSAVARTGAAAALLLAAACNPEEEAGGITIQSTPAELRGMRITAEASGQLEPVLRVEVKSKASGEILELFVDSGDEVELGDTLARVDPRDVENAWDQAVADYQVAQVRRDLAREQLRRSQDLLEAEVITRQDFESRELEYANAEAAFVRAQTNRELAALRRTDVTISAPMAGTILEKQVEYGQVIQSATQNVSGGTTLFIMANLDNMRVRTLVDETDVGKLEAGLPATVTVEAFPDRNFQGYIEKIEPQAIASQNVTMFPVIVLLDNSAGLLKPGMNAEVEVLVDERTETLAAPNNAIVQPQEVAAAAEVLGMDPDAVALDFQAYGPLMGQAAARFAELGGSGSREGAMAAGGFPGGRGGAFGGAGDNQAGDGGADGERTSPGGAAAGTPAGAAAANGMPSMDEMRRKVMSGEISPDSARALWSAMRGQAGGAADRSAGGAGPANGGADADPAGAGDPGAAPAGNRQGGGGERPAGMGGRGGAGFGGGAGGGRGAGGFGGGFGGMMGAMRGGNDTPYKPAVVFVIDDAGDIEPRPVVIGLSDWDYVEVLAGLREGEQLALIGPAQLQARQQEQMERMRQRMRAF